MAIEPEVLLVEDDAELRAQLVRGLHEEGFRVRGVATGVEALTEARRAAPAAFVVDIGLPDADGRDVCQALRAQGQAAPIIFLTAREALVDRLAGFRSGGDDYVVKPFSFDELVARLHAHIRRGVPGAGSASVGRLELDAARHAATVGGTRIELTPTEFRILARLCASPGEAIRRRTLVAAAWPHGAVVHDNTLDTYIARLRRKLAAAPGGPVIHTTHGVGYRLE